MTAIGFTDNYPHEGSFIAYLNGIEVPVQSVEVRMGVNTNPSATFEMVPDPIIQRIGAEDRLEAAVFYLDDVYPDINKKGSASDFRLLYEGEITGWSYTNSAMGRRIGLNSVGFLQILYDLFPYFISGPESLALSTFSEPTGNEATFVTNPMCFPWNRFFYGFDQTESKLIRRPYDLIMNVLGACTGVKEQSLLGSVVTTNFYARYMRKIGFANRFLPSPIIETDILHLDEETGVFPILRAVRDTEIVETLARGAAQAGSGAPVWPTIQQMLLRMYYETLCITTAPIVQVNRVPDSPDNGVVLGPPKFTITTDPAKDTEERRKIEEALEKDIEAAVARAEQDLILEIGIDDPDFQRQLNLKEAEIRAAYESLLPQKPDDAQKPNCILNYVTKPQWLFGVVPSCNVVFPSMVQEFRFEEDYKNQPTRMYINDMWYAELTGTNNPAQQAMATLRAGYPEQVQRELEKRYGIAEAGVSGNPGISGKNFIVWPEEFYKGPQPASIRLPNWFEMLSQFVQTKQTVDQQKAADALKEIESLSLRGESIDSKVQELILQGVLPPEVEAQKEKKGSAYKGNVYTVNAVKSILRTRANDQNVAMDVLRKGYARYEYYRQRAQCRSGAVVMTFNPYIVPGFPAFIFDDLTSGCHTVGYVVGVTHSLTSESWITQMNFTYGQTLDEFMQELFDARVGNTIHGVLTDQAAAPVNPIEPLREVLQVQERAEDYFSLLFHQKADYAGVKTCAFDFNRAIRLVLPSGEGHAFNEAIEAESVTKEIGRRLDEEKKGLDEFQQKIADYSAKIRLEVVAEEGSSMEAWQREAVEDDIREKISRYEQQLWEDVYAKQAEDMALAPKPGLPSDLLQKYVAIRPSNEFAAMFRNHTNAMRFIARPVCTLLEYIAFRGKFGAKTGKILPSDPVQGKGAVFYEKILNLKQGPGEAPTFDENNNLVTPLIADVPDTRADWETRLKAYRSKVLFKRAGWRPDV
jgi:hypothetical protein